MLSLGALLLTAGIQSVAAHPNLTGILDPVLTPSEPATPISCVPSSKAERERIADVESRKGRAWTCKLFCLTPPGERLGILLERRWRRLVLFIDVNRDGEFATDERHELVPEHDLVVGLGPSEGTTVTYPVAIRIASPVWKPYATPGQRLLLQTVLATYRGSVTVAGRTYRVEYPTDGQTLAPATQGSWMGFDTNGDGTIEGGSLSTERVFAHSNVTMFRLGDRYVSTISINPVTHEVQLREHPSSDYRRIELRAGNVVPDFAFTDLLGRSRRLSDLRGRFVVLAIWSSWCGPAVAELRNIERAHRMLAAKGLTVLGLPDDHDVEAVRKAITTHGVTWLNASPDSVQPLINERFQTASNPIIILLDSDRRIVMASIEEFNSPLRGPALLKTLQRLMR